MRRFEIALSRASCRAFRWLAIPRPRGSSAKGGPPLAAWRRLYLWLV
jgi:hypothetical protein